MPREIEITLSFGSPRVDDTENRRIVRSGIGQPTRSALLVEARQLCGRITRRRTPVTIMFNYRAMEL